MAIDERTGEVQAVGHAARRMIGRTPAHITATRPLRHGVIADFYTTEQMLGHFMRKVGAGRRGSRTHVMVCVPSGLTSVERGAVEEAALSAGARRAFLIEEPLAGAIGAGLPVAEASGSLVVDVGGGTSEMAVTALGGMVVSRSIRIGGYELDDAIVRLAQAKGRLLIGQEEAEQLKIAIGSATAESAPNATGQVAGRDLTSGPPAPRHDRRRRGPGGARASAGPDRRRGQGHPRGDAARTLVGPREPGPDPARRRRPAARLRPAPGPRDRPRGDDRRRAAHGRRARRRGRARADGAAGPGPWGRRARPSRR